MLFVGQGMDSYKRSLDLPAYLNYTILYHKEWYV